MHTATVCMNQKGQCKHQVAVKFNLMDVLDSKENISTLENHNHRYFPLKLYIYILKNYYKIKYRF